MKLFAGSFEQPVQFTVRGDLKVMESNQSHIIHMYRPFLNGCSFDVMTHIWLKIKKACAIWFGVDNPNKLYIYRI